LADAVPAAGAVHVVNNGAAALALVATALAGPATATPEIVIARGELVEIGDGFRIPALLEATGARLREVGTTNRVTRADYAAAVGEDTAFVLKVHPSNFVVRGFTSACGIDELADLGVPVVADIGSGLLAPHPLLPDEPDAATALAQGATLVTASGDKLLGGPQAGVIAGRADLVDACARHPLYRALRPGGLVLAALQRVTLAYLARDIQQLPFWRMATTPVAVLQRRAEALGVGDVVGCASITGGGTLPGIEIASAGVVVSGDATALLRAARPRAVIARVADDTTILDLRTVDPADDEEVARALRSLPGHE
jgi:L-seryl-tRNA(Ser) seleniumtransferase